MVLSTDSLANKLSPRLKEILLSRKEEIIASVGILYREPVRLAFPVFLDEVPNLLHSAIDLISDEFGKMNVNDLIAFLESHATR